MVTLNEGQKKAKEGIQKFLMDPNPKNYECTLVGFAGTGKTFLLNYILEDFPSRSIVAATVSHSAKNILKESMGEWVQCCTIAQLLGLTQEFVNGKEVFKKAGRAEARPIDRANIVVIDECSMIDDYTMHLIRSSIPKHATTKIIYSGDSAQLPPVDEGALTEDAKYKPQKISPTFAVKNTFVLTEVVRYGNLVGTVGKYYRDLIMFLDNGGSAYNAQQGLLSFVPTWQSSSEIIWFTRDVSGFLQSAITDFQQNMLETRIIAYRNETIDRNNEVIRPYFFPEDTKYSVGEYLILNRPYVFGKEILHNGTVIQILKCEAVRNHSFGVPHPNETGEYGTDVQIRLDAWKLTVGIINLSTSEIEREATVFAIHQDSEDEYTEVQQQIIERAKTVDSRIWKHLNNLRSRNIFASRYYCVSCYKAQGQSIENTYVMLSDIMDVNTISVSTMFRSIYVAITRTKKKCIVLY